MTRRRAGGGKVHLVGAGPGAPDLITVRGRELLERADVVIYDTLASAELLALAPAGSDLVPAGSCRGRGGEARLHRLMIREARRGRAVVRLKGGDPTIFGRAGEEGDALARAGVPFAIVPGVTAALGAAAAAGIPLTDRRWSSSVMLATAHEDPSKGKGQIDWAPLAAAGTLVLYMAVGRLDGAVRRLLRHGRAPATPAALVRWATRPDQVVVIGTLGDIAARARRARLEPPALLIVGDVVRLGRRLGPRSRPPLAGRTIVVTRARGQAAAFSALLREAGARVVEAPAIAFAPPRSWAAVDRALARIEDYRFVVFTSVNGVESFFGRLLEKGGDVRDLAGVEIAAIGPATASAVRSRGLRTILVPDTYQAEGLVALLRPRLVRGQRVLLARAAVARAVLPRALRRAGARLDVVTVYRTMPERGSVARALAAGGAAGVDLLTFTSSSTVERFAAALRGGALRRARRVPAAAIGPITAATARRLGFRVVIVPREATIPALAAAIVRRLRSSPSGTPRGS